MKKIFNFLLICLFALSCSGIQMLSGPSKADLYTENFLMKIGSIKEQYRQGFETEALNTLQQINEDQLRPAEKAMRRNFIGAIYFSKGEYEKAIFNFSLAEPLSRDDPSLNARVKLNLASSYYKIEKFDKSMAAAKSIDVLHMTELDQKKLNLLKFRLSKEVKDPETEVRALIGYLKPITNLQQLKQDQYFNQLMTTYFSMDQKTRVRLLENYDGEALAINYLAYLEAEKVYYKGNKSDAKNYLDWIADNSKNYPEIIDLINVFKTKMGNYAKIDVNSIGVVVPLSDRRSIYAKRLLSGIESALKKSGQDIKLHIADSKGSGAVGALRIKELVEKKHVAAVIGGLFPQEAVKEYEEAKRHGTVFISLSEVFLPREAKDHLLIEIVGSVESQIAAMFSDDMLNFLGRKAAIVYPYDERGDAYVNEFWRMAGLHNVHIAGAISFTPNRADYRAPVKNILGLNFPRERQEEVEILTEVYSHQRSAVRRVQTLRPQIDFDWVFVPAYPKDAMQLIPAFKYFDAYPINIVGVPSWRSKKLMAESPKLGRLYFMGDELGNDEEAFSQSFYKRYKRNPKLIELRGYDSLELITKLFNRHQFETRDEMDMFLRSEKELKGLTGTWRQVDGLWLKDMTPLKIRRNKVEKVFGGEEEQVKEIED